MEDLPIAESQISKTLSERTTRMVIILILCMLFLMPLFQLETYFESTTSFEIGLNQLIKVYNSYKAGTLTKLDYDTGY
jgi:hypothetical protein